VDNYLFLVGQICPSVLKLAIGRFLFFFEKGRIKKGLLETAKH
jgi:hypothetical protein